MAQVIVSQVWSFFGYQADAGYTVPLGFVMRITLSDLLFNLNNSYLCREVDSFCAVKVAPSLVQAH